jgi:hypothetical protein
MSRKKKPDETEAPAVVAESTPSIPDTAEAPPPAAPSVPTEALATALSSHLGGRVTVSVDGDDVVATGTHGEARTSHAGRTANEIYESLRGGLAK